jgi:purine-binding chemotaxis protein CheW
MHEAPLATLVCRVRDVLCAVPLEHVEETMRPMPLEPIAGVPAFVSGLAVVRGIPTPVIDAATLFSGTPGQPSRFVTVKAGSRRVVLAVDAVVGVAKIPRGSIGALPPLFQGAGLDAIAAVGTLDAELLLVLRNTCLVPDDIWAAIQGAGAGA